MRPTYLQFRSPKERTEFTAQLFTNNYGDKLFNESFIKSERSSPTQQKSQFSCSFAPSERFKFYKQLEKQTGVFLGPGKYQDHEQFINLNQNPCLSVIKKEQQQLDYIERGQCYYIGDNLVVDTHANKLLGRKNVSFYPRNNHQMEFNFNSFQNSQSPLDQNQDSFNQTQQHNNEQVEFFQSRKKQRMNRTAQRVLSNDDLNRSGLLQRYNLSKKEQRRVKRVSQSNVQGYSQFLESPISSLRNSPIRDIKSQQIRYNDNEQLVRSSKRKKSRASKKSLTQVRPFDDNSTKATSNMTPYYRVQKGTDGYLTPNLNNYFEFMKKVNEVDVNQQRKKRRIRNIRDIRTEVQNSPNRQGNPQVIASSGDQTYQYQLEQKQNDLVNLSVEVTKLLEAVKKNTQSSPNSKSKNFSDIYGKYFQRKIKGYQKLEQHKKKIQSLIHVLNLSHKKNNNDIQVGDNQQQDS